ncbi:haloacid dehalogenase-like hydrolase [Desulfobacterales bacterium HSG2]|nr:haloacid dehalogenase-like hydrolase [Desulfobacterales bacterium HSG2]
MKNTQPKKIRLVSCDLNGTLVHQHTMMDMIRLGFPHAPERYEKAKDVFTRQTSGLLSMKETFEIAGPLTKGLSLRNAIEYARSEMRFLEGFEEFISALREKGIYFVINSTGYTVTTEVIKAVYGPENFYDAICNRLIFGREGDPDKLVSDHDISDLVKDYFLKRTGDRAESVKANDCQPVTSTKKFSDSVDTVTENCYDEILTTGEVELGIRDENEKARLIFEIADKLNISREAVAHIGDTMGDSGGISEVAGNGGLGIAFNYNNALKNHLEGILKNKEISGKIVLTEPKSETSDLRCLLNLMLDA